MDQQNTPQQPVSVAPSVQPTSGLAVAALIVGILAFLSGFFWFIAIPLALAGLVMGIISLVKKMGGKGMAVAGVILSAIALLFASIFALVTIVFVAAAPEAIEQSMNDNSVNRRDNLRKINATAASSAIMTTAGMNDGVLPAFSELTIENLSSVPGSELKDPSTNLPYKLVEGDSTGTDTFGYKAGVDCDGVAGERKFSLTVKLEQDGSLYCRGL